MDAHNHPAAESAPSAPPVKRHPYDQWSPDARALDLVGDKWTLLIVRDLITGPRRFVELQRVLPGISTEQLRSRLNRMVADGMLTRKRYREVPPRVDYELTDRARDLMAVVGELARWGQVWAWGAPRPEEAIDLGAIFRLAPGLLADARLTGTLTLELTDAQDGKPDAYRIAVSPQGVQVREGAPERADARVSGPRSAWIAAFSPPHDRRGLAIEGDAALVARVLDALSGREKQPAAAPA